MSKIGQNLVLLKRKLLLGCTSVKHMQFISADMEETTGVQNMSRSKITQIPVSVNDKQRKTKLENGDLWWTAQKSVSSEDDLLKQIPLRKKDSAEKIRCLYLADGSAYGAATLTAAGENDTLINVNLTGANVFTDIDSSLASLDGLFAIGGYLSTIDSGSREFLFNGTGGTNFFKSVLTIETTIVPVPAAVWLFGSGLIGFIGVARRKSRV